MDGWEFKNSVTSTVPFNWVNAYYEEYLLTFTSLISLRCRHLWQTLKLRDARPPCTLNVKGKRKILSYLINASLSLEWMTEARTMLNKLNFELYLTCSDPAFTWLLTFQFVLQWKTEDGVASVCSVQELHHLNTDRKCCLAGEGCEWRRQTREGEMTTHSLS